MRNFLYLALTTLLFVCSTILLGLGNAYVSLSILVLSLLLLIGILTTNRPKPGR